MSNYDHNCMYAHAEQINNKRETRRKTKRFFKVLENFILWSGYRGEPEYLVFQDKAKRHTINICWKALPILTEKGVQK